MASRRLSSRDERWEVRYSVWMQVCTVPPNPTDLRPVGAIFDRVMDQSPGIQVTRRTDCSVSKAWSIGGGFLSRLEFDGCRCVRTSAIQLRFSIYLSPFSLSLFLLFLISVFPSRAGVFLGQSTANDWVGRYVRYFRVLFPTQWMHRIVVHRCSAAARMPLNHASHLHDVPG